MNKQTCKLPFKAISIDILGNIQPCPRIFGKTKYSLGNIKDTSFLKNWKEKNKFRDSLEKGEKNDLCENCPVKEKYEEIYKEQAADYKINPTILEIRFSNLCNFSCKMCDEKISSRIAQEKKKQEYYYKEEPLQKNTTFWKDVNDILPSLERIYIGGGEPLINPVHTLFLEKIIVSGFAKKIHLVYHSNLSVIPGVTEKRPPKILLGKKTIFDFWKEFKKVEVFGSCDGYKETYEKIRQGGVWEIFSKNTLLLKKLGFLGGVSLTIQKDNIFDIPNIVSWTDQKGICLDYKFLEKPVKLRIKKEKEKQKIIAFYTKIQAKNPKKIYRDIIHYVST